MRPNRSKPPCKFKGTCRNFRENKECPFSHQKCLKGDVCQNIQNCLYYHESVPNAFKRDFKQQSKFEKPKNQTQCKFGMSCKKRLDGTCGFKHTQTSENSQIRKYEPRGEQKPFSSKADVLCRFGQKCTNFPLGKCSFKHETAQLVLRTQQRTPQNYGQQKSQPQKVQNHTNIFQRICIDFLLNNNCNQSCQKLHQFSETKTISRIFSICDIQKQEIKKIMVMQSYQPDEQPLYVIVCNKRISFGQLTNLAKETGNENIGNSSLVMKKCHQMEIQFQGQLIQNAWLTKIQEGGQRVDILVCKCTKEVKIVLLNRENYLTLPTAEGIINVVPVGTYLLILFKSGKTTCFDYSFVSNGFQCKGQPFLQPFLQIKKYGKKFNEEELIAAIIPDGVCFINKQFKTYHMKFNQKVTDIIFTQITSFPAAFVLTSPGKIYAVNLLTFEASILLQPEIPNSATEFSCLTLTNQHLFVAIDTFGVIVYNVQKYDKPVGIIGLNSSKWKIESDQRGNLLLLSEHQSGRKDIAIFKVRKN